MFNLSVIFVCSFKAVNISKKDHKHCNLNITFTVNITNTLRII